MPDNRCPLYIAELSRPITTSDNPLYPLLTPSFLLCYSHLFEPVLIAKEFTSSVCCLLACLVACDIDSYRRLPRGGGQPQPPFNTTTSWSYPISSRDQLLSIQFYLHTPQSRQELRYLLPCLASLLPPGAAGVRTGRSCQSPS